MARDYAVVKDRRITLSVTGTTWRSQVTFSTVALWALRRKLPGSAGCALARLIHRDGRTHDSDLRALKGTLRQMLARELLDETVSPQAHDLDRALQGVVLVAS